MSNNYKPRFGEIWMAHLNEIGSVQGGYRPVFIVSNDLNNEYSPTVNIIPLTSRVNKRNLPVHVYLGKYEAYGLKVPSTMLIEQIATVNVESLDRKIGCVSDAQTLLSIQNAMAIQFPVFLSHNRHDGQVA